jgi:small GTP-binding protein
MALTEIKEEDVYKELNNVNKPLEEIKSYVIKCVILGDSCVGKTSIINYYLTNKMKNTDTTLGAIFWLLERQMDNGDFIKLNVWDTAGQERYNSLIPMYTRSSDIIILTFSLTDRVSFENLLKWKNTTKYCSDVENLKFIIIGNKSDLENYICITDKDIKNMIRKHFPKETEYFKTSALSGDNINLVFNGLFSISEEIVNENKKKKYSYMTINQKKSLNDKKFTCCN